MKRAGIKYLVNEQKTRFIKFLKLRKDAVRACALYSVMLNTGLRLAETVALNVQDVKDRTTLEVLGKGSKVREIPLNKSMREHLQEFLRWKQKKGESIEPDAPLFVSRKRGRISKRAVQRDLAKWTKEAGIEGRFSPHALRHTVGTELMRKTGNIRLVQTFLGHSDISTTQIYTHVTKEQVQEAAELLAA